MNLEATFKSYVTEHDLGDADTRTLVAVSGGMDSMVLLQLFIRAGFEIGVAHCNFHLRSKESDRDQQFVRDYCDHWQVPFYTTEFDTVSYAESHNLGIQAAARKLRYTWFESLANSKQYDVIATGHHADDQIETVLLNIGRGAGIAGLKGMAPKRGRIIRPLLGIRRNEIAEYATKNKISFREDGSNANNKYSRNYLRNKILPLVTRRLPGFENRMLENIHIWQKSARLLHGFIQQQIDIAKKTQGSLQVLDCEKIDASLHDLVLFEWLRPYHFNYSQVQQMIRALENGSGGQIFYSRQYRVSIDRGKVLLQTTESLEKNEIEIGREDQLVHVSNGKLQFSLLSEPPNTYDNGHIAFFDARIITFPLILRNWHKGDSFQPFGMRGKRQKIKKFFVNEKMNRFEKESQWLLCSDMQICWVVGRRLDHRFRVTSSTSLCLRVHWSPLNN
ncbi:MAG: tRNA lysidine(34) synthetase TilS [Saprospiraceae bacterium]|nr:tRNA lysidine(34) synthetase TilS [Saprospiraceae bacterium]